MFNITELLPLDYEPVCHSFVWSDHVPAGTTSTTSLEWLIVIKQVCFYLESITLTLSSERSGTDVYHYIAALRPDLYSGGAFAGESDPLYLPNMVLGGGNHFISLALPFNSILYPHSQILFYFMLDGDCSSLADPSWVKFSFSFNGFLWRPVDNVKTGKKSLSTVPLVGRSYSIILGGD